MIYTLKQPSILEYREALRTKMSEVTCSVEDVTDGPDFPLFKRLCFFKDGEIVHDHPANDRHMDSALELLPLDESWVTLKVLVNFRQSLREFFVQGGWNRLPDGLAEKSYFNQFTRSEFNEWMDYAMDEDARHHGCNTFENPLKEETEVSL